MTKKVEIEKFENAQYQVTQQGMDGMPHHEFMACYFPMLNPLTPNDL
jgi:hypothetical protein